MDTYLFTITTEPDPTEHLCNLRHREVQVMAKGEPEAWAVVCDLYSTLRCPNLVAITLTDTLV